jgi:hypothetical protein
MTDPLIKLYAGLTDQERGKMAYTYLIQGNDLEMQRIVSAMPNQNFIGLPDGYRRMVVDLSNLTMIYAIAYWQQVARCVTMMAGTMGQLQDEDPEAYKPMIECFKAEEAALMSIEQAFDDVCLEHGLDAGAMRTMAGKQFYTIATPDLKTDDACLAGYLEIFASTVNDGLKKARSF